MELVQVQIALLRSIKMQKCNSPEKIEEFRTPVDVFSKNYKLFRMTSLQKSFDPVECHKFAHSFWNNWRKEITGQIGQVELII